MLFLKLVKNIAIFLKGWKMARWQQSNAPDTTWTWILWWSGMWQRRMLESTPSWYESRNTDSTRISHSHSWSMVRNADWIPHPPITWSSVCCSSQWLNFALVSVCVVFLIHSESSDRGESGVIAGSRLCATGEQTSSALHIPWCPSSAHPVALSCLPIQRPVSSFSSPLNSLQSCRFIFYKQNNKKLSYFPKYTQ